MIAAKGHEAETEGGAQDRPRRMLTEKQVLEIVPVSPVTLWRMEKKGRFPERELYQREPESLVRGRDNRVAERGQWTRSRP